MRGLAELQEILGAQAVAEPKTRRSEAGWMGAAFVGTAVAPVAIGALHVASEVSPFVKKMLTLHAGIGPYSGKVLFGYLAGLLAAATWKLVAGRIAGSAGSWFAVLFVGLVAGTALVFTPVVHWLVHLLG